MCTLDEMTIDEIRADVARILAVLSPDDLRKVQALFNTNQFESWQVQELVGATPFSI